MKTILILITKILPLETAAKPWPWPCCCGSILVRRDGERPVVRRAVGQVSLVEALLPATFGSNPRLERIRVQVDWQPIEAVLRPMRRAPTGRPAYPPLVQLKALLLQQWYRLSDRDLEEALADRLSFRRFCGLGLEDAVPDATILSRFRIDLAEAGLAEAVFDELNRQLEQRGLLIKAGRMIDAIPARIFLMRAMAWLEPAPADAGWWKLT